MSTEQERRRALEVVQVGLGVLIVVWLASIVAFVIRGEWPVAVGMVLSYLLATAVSVVPSPDR